MFHTLRFFPVAFGALLAACSSSPPPPRAATAPSDAVANAVAAAPAPHGTDNAGDDANVNRFPPYELSNTEVREIRSDRLGRRYPLLISLPRDYATSGSKRYPVLLITDVNYAFPLVRSIGAMVGDKGAGLEDFLLVGLGYADGDSPPYSRRRDYTPTRNGPRDAAPDESGRPPQHGEAEAYRRFVAEEVLPFVEANYRADSARRIFAGHSYGALFGAHVLLTEPAMFERYILSSPSLWFDRRVMFERERRYAATHADLPAKVFLSIGSYETLAPTSGNPRYNRNLDMVADLRAFEAQLKTRRYPGLQIESIIVPGEDHLSVYPAAITRALRWALPAPR